MSTDNLLGTTWQHNRKGHRYRVVEINPKTDGVRLQALTKGARSTWKYAPLLPFDYTEIKEEKP